MIKGKFSLFELGRCWSSEVARRSGGVDGSLDSSCIGAENDDDGAETTRAELPTAGRKDLPLSMEPGNGGVDWPGCPTRHGLGKALLQPGELASGAPGVVQA